jgi:hypothetical protein
MNPLKKVKRVLEGILAGGFLTMFVPMTPIGLTGTVYELDALAWQPPVRETTVTSPTWSYRYIPDHGFILQRDRIETSTPTHLRHAVFKVIVDHNGE